MAQQQVIPTRMELTRLKRRLVTARRGHKLLKDKCDELMKIFLDCVRENKALRTQTEESMEHLRRSFSAASAVMSKEMLEETLICPDKKGELSIDYRNVMSVLVPEYTFRTTDADSAGAGGGLAFTTSELDSAYEVLGEVVNNMMLLAQAEKKAQMLASEIEKTRRRVNALEYIMIPDLTSKIKVITMKLDENERGNITRLMKVKDLMLQQK